MLWALIVLLIAGIFPQKAFALTYEQTSSSQPKAIWDYLYAQLGNAYGVAGIMGNMYMESGLKPNNLDNTANKVFGMSDEEYTNAVDSGSYTAFATDKSYYGLNQWGGSRKQKLLNYAKSIDASVGSLTAQLGFIMQELGTSYFSGLKNTIKSATSIREASDRWLAVYGGVPNKDEASKAARAARGQVYFDAYAPEEVKNPPAQSEPDPAEPADPAPSETPAPSSDPAPQADPAPSENSKPQDDPAPSGNTAPAEGPAPSGTSAPPETPQTGAANSAPPSTGSAPKPAAQIASDTPNDSTVFLSNDNRLKSLSVSGCSLSPSFRSSVTNYRTEVNYGITSVDVSAVKNNSKASVSISGGKDLAVGNNTVRIVVTAQDGGRRTYTVNVVRRDKGISFDADEVFEGSQTAETQAEVSGGTEEPGPGKQSSDPGEWQDTSLPKKGSSQWYMEKAALTFESIRSHPLPYYIYIAAALVVLLLILLIVLLIRGRQQ